MNDTGASAVVEDALFCYERAIDMKLQALQSKKSESESRSESGGAVADALEVNSIQPSILEYLKVISSFASNRQVSGSISKAF
jgi:hypothetical protein